MDSKDFIKNIDFDFGEDEVDIADMARNKLNLKFISTDRKRQRQIHSLIFRYSNRIRLYAENVKGDIIDTEYSNAFINFFSKGLKAEILLGNDEDLESTSLYQIIERYSNRSESNIKIIKITEEGKKALSKLTNSPSFLLIGNDNAYSFDFENKGRMVNCFNDRLLSSALINTFDESFLISQGTMQLYKNNNFIKSCNQIQSFFDVISLELIEYFSKHPDDLQKLEWRNFEKLLDAIFKNQGFTSYLGPGNKGIDLRLVQNDKFGEIVTLVQAKKYKKENPIQLEAVQALTAMVDHQKANRGLFVTTSRYLPGVEDWAKEQSSRIILAKSDHVAKWCEEIATGKRDSFIN